MTGSAAKGPMKRRASRRLRQPSFAAVERLESRTLLAADLATAALTSRLAWAGREVSVRSDAWVVTAPTVAAGGPGLASGWQSRPLGEGLFSVTAPAASTADMLAWAARTPGVEAVEPDVIIASAALPDDPSYDRLWGLTNSGQSGGLAGADIDAVGAWDVTTGSRGVVVAVIDTGVDYRHPDLSSNIWRNAGEVAGNGIDDDRNGFVDDLHGWDFANNDGDPFDDEGHGTHVAGTIGAVGNNATGVVGVNWEVSIMALKFLGADGSGSTSDAIAAVNYATRMRREFGVNLVATNNSWGGGGSSAAMRRAIQAGGDAGILFVAAAGNEGSDNDRIPSYPASEPASAVIAVAATDRSNRLASFSNYGATSVDIAAPGAAIYSTVPGDAYASYSGTSMATPHVTGAVALLAAAHPTSSAAARRAAILGSAAAVPALAGKVATGGLLDLAAALTAAGSPAQPPTEPQPPTDPAPQPPTDPQPPPAGPGEPDDSLATALAIDGGTAAVAGSIGDGSYAGRDVDLFAVALAAGDLLAVDVDAESLPQPSGLDSLLRLFDAAGRQLATNDDADGSLDSRLAFTAPASGTYFVGLSSYGNSRYDPRIAGSGRSGSTAGGYVVRFERATTPLTADIVDVEPDPRTTAVDAVFVDFSRPVSGFDAVDLELARDGAAVPLDGVTVSTGDGLRWAVSGLRSATAAPGRYTLSVAAGGVVDDAGAALADAASDSWTLVTGVAADAGDTIRQAAVVTARDGEVRVAGQVGDGRYRSRDVDLYRVTLAAGQSLAVDVVARLAAGTSGLDSYLRLFDSRGRQLAANDDSSGSLDSALAFTALRGGDFYLGVSGYGNSRYSPLRAGSGRAGSTGAYEFLLTFGSVPTRRGPAIAGFRDGGEPAASPRLTAFAQFAAAATLVDGDSAWQACRARTSRHRPSAG